MLIDWKKEEQCHKYTSRKHMKEVNVKKSVVCFIIFFWYGDCSENSRKRNSSRTKHFRIENVLFILGGSLTCQSFLDRIEVIIPMKYLYFGGSTSFSHNLLVCTVNSPISQNSKLMQLCPFQQLLAL